MLWIALHLPHFILDTLTPSWRTEAAFVYAAQGKGSRTVTACSPLARQAGVRPGMPLTSARSLAPLADIQVLSPQALAERYDDISALLLPYTPCLVQAESYTLLLEVSASLRLFGGLPVLRRRLLHTLRPQEVSLRVATATNADAAWLLAVHPGAHIRHALSSSTLTRRLHTLHCRHLPAALPYRDWLDGIGCQELSMLRALPRAELQRRTSPLLLYALDRLYGQAQNTRLSWFVPPNHFHQRLELPSPGTQSEALIFAAQRLLRPFCLWLEQRQQAATHISLLFEHDARRHDQAYTPLMLQSAQAIWHPEGWLRLLRAHLAHFPLPAPVLALRLQSHQLHDRPKISASLLPSSNTALSASYEDTLTLLAARLGREAMRQAQPRDDHRPEAANAWACALSPRKRLLSEHTSDTCLPAQEPAAMGPRPSWLLENAQPLHSRDGQPWHHGPLQLLQGPERIEDGWWAAPMRRDYYVAQSAQGACYWVFYTHQGDQSGWYLHGLFG